MFYYFRNWVRISGLLIFASFVVIFFFRSYILNSGELSEDQKGRNGKKQVKVPLKFDQCHLTRDYQMTSNGSSKSNALPNPNEFRQLEKLQWDEIKSKLPVNSFRIFYHTSTWRKFWADVIEEQLSMMDNGLLEVADLYLNIVGSRTSGDFEKVQSLVKKQKLRHPEKIILNFNETVARFVYKRSKGADHTKMANNLQLSEGEYSTITALQQYCVAETSKGNDAYVLYLHNKGGCCSRTKSNNKIDPTNDNVCAWREAMNAFSIEYPSICARAILEGNYATCGFEFLVDFHTAHYSGNFFWANCKHVASLSPLVSRFDSFAAELFLFNRSKGAGSVGEDEASLREQNRLFGQRCGYSTFNCCMNFYKSECTKERWGWKLAEMLGWAGSVPESAKQLNRMVQQSNADLTGRVGLPSKQECSPH